MKTIRLILSVLVVFVFVACNNSKSEPEIGVIKDGKATLKIGAPSLASNTNNSAIRKIHGSISGDNIVFSWDANNIIEFVFYKGTTQIGTTEYTVTQKDINNIGADNALKIEVPVPEGADKFDIASGPTTLPRKQYYYNGIPNGAMRFEKNGCSFTEDIVYMTAIWSALIIVPAMEFTYDPQIADYMLYCSADYGFTKMTIQQTINSIAQPEITYCAKDIKGNDKAVTLSAMGGQKDIATPYIVVVDSAKTSSLDITIEYNSTYFTGKVSEGSTVYFTLAPSDPAVITTKSMHADAVPALASGQAYQIEALKNHPLKVHWNATEQ